MSKLINSTVLCIIIIVYPLLWVWQGIDLTDTGFALTNYTYTFSNPELISSALGPYYITNVIAGLIVRYLDFGLIGIRLFALPFIYGIVLLSFKVLKDYISNKKVLLLGLLIAEMFIIKTGIILSYNLITCFFLSLMIFLIIQNIKKGNFIYSIFAAIVYVLLVFSRIPNILLGAIFIPQIVYYFTGNKKWTDVIKFSGSFLVGLIIGFGLLSLLVLKFDQKDALLTSLNELINLGSSDSDTHSFGSLLYKLGGDYAISAVESGFYLVLFSTFFLLLTGVIKRFKGILIVAVPIIYIVVIEIIHSYFGFRTRFQGIDYAVLFIIFLGYIFIKERNRANKLIISIALASLIIIPIGSGNGLIIYYYGLWLVIPILIGYIYNKNNLRLRNLIIDNDKYRMLKYSIAACLLLISLKFNFTNLYRDNSNRLLLTHKLNHPKLKFINTTKERADCLNELFQEYSKYIIPGDYMLSVGNTPLFHYLFEAKPYMGSSWPLLYTDDKFVERLKKAPIQNDNHPVILYTKFNVCNNLWPQSKLPLSKINKDKEIKKFIQKHRYALKWSNSFFEIYTTDI